MGKIKSYFSKSFEIFSLVTIILIFSCSKLKSTGDSNLIDSIEEYRRIRMEKLNQPRPVIHNNDGCDAYLYPADRNFSIQNFLDFRSAGLKGTDVSTISYCTISSSFGQFTHNTKVGEFLTLTHNRPGRKNVVPEFVKLGTDPLEVTSKYARENGFEFFWSNRVNDTHDAGHRPDSPYERWSKLKQAHPEYLFGTVGERLPHGRWSAIDFSNREIRDLCVQYYTEVCENYDIDGIELDFFRHLYLFKEVARGAVATEEQLEMLTDMVSQIREMTERVGMKKGKPILVLVRVPDTSEYCLGVGIDIETWMEKGLVDIVVGSGYFRLNFWDNLVEQAHKHGIKVYAGLSEPRVKEEHPLLMRKQNQVYRARSAAVWQAGVDGIYIFNEYNTRSRYLKEIGSADKLKDKNKLYFATYRNGNPNSYLVEGKNYSNLPDITPTNQHVIDTSPLKVQFELGDESVPAKIALILYTGGGNPGDLKASLNGTELLFSKMVNDEIAIFTIPQEFILPGLNSLSISNNKKKEEVTLLDSAILFQRDSNDQDTRELSNLCFAN
jgi:hypothetical protein